MSLSGRLSYRKPSDATQEGKWNFHYAKHFKTSTCEIIRFASVLALLPICKRVLRQPFSACGRQNKIAPISRRKPFQLKSRHVLGESPNKVSESNISRQKTNNLFIHEACEFSKRAVARIEAVFQSLVYDIKLLYYCYFPLLAPVLLYCAQTWLHHRTFNPQSEK